MGNSVQSLSRLETEAISQHNQTTAKSKMKIFLFGTNAGKSNWFNGSADHQPLVGIAFKAESFSIGDKLPDIETIIYDTADNMGFVDENLKYITNADGIILTYNIYNVESLNDLKKSVHKIIQHTFFSTKHTRCLLLGIKEVKEIKNPLHFQHTNCIDDAQKFASQWNLFHKQIDITMDINTKEPFIYLLRRILKQKTDDDDDDEDKDEDKEDDAEHDDDDEEDEDDDDDENEDTLVLIHDIIGDFVYREEEDLYEPGSPTTALSHLSGDYKKNMDILDKINEDDKEDIDYDRECQKEFKRFLETSVGKKRCDKYLNRFIETKSNDIRFVDPDIFDDALLSNDDMINMDLLDKKLFMKEIEKYRNDCIKFEDILNTLKMKEKYHKQFVNRGIATLWSFYYHLKSAKHIEKITKNKKDALMIWKNLKSEHDDDDYDDDDDDDDIKEVFGDGDDNDIIKGLFNVTNGDYKNGQVEGGDISDSDDMYDQNNNNNHDIYDNVNDGGHDMTTTITSGYPTSYKFEE